MIYTITVNPSIDYIMRNEEPLQLGAVNRLDETAFLAGGKGVNVSQILNQLAVPNQAWGFLGGFTGAFVASELKRKQINQHFTAIQANSRISVKLKADLETELNAAGPTVTSSEIASFKAQFKQLKPGDIVVMSGSLLPSLPTDFYHQLINLTQEQHGEFVVDTTGQALLDTLPERPLVIKPNHHELAALFNTTFKDDADLIAHGQQLLQQGAQHVLISMAGAGAYLITPEHVYHSAAPKGQVVNSVGAGDSMIAGFVGEFSQHHDPVQAFNYGLACGSATAFTEDIATREQIEAIRPQIKITTVI